MLDCFSIVELTRELAFTITDEGKFVLQKPFGSGNSSMEDLEIGQKYLQMDIFNTLNGCQVMCTYILINLGTTKIWRVKFGELMVIRQIRQCFPPPKFHTIWYFHSAYAAQSHYNTKTNMECDLPSVCLNSAGMSENSPV